MPSVYVSVGVPPTDTKVQPFGHVHLDSSLFVFNFSLNMARQPEGYTFVTGCGEAQRSHARLFYNEERAPEVVLLL